MILVVMKLLDDLSSLFVFFFDFLAVLLFFMKVRKSLIFDFGFIELSIFLKMETAVMFH